MFNKFKVNQKVRVNGTGKKDDKYYNNQVGKIIERDNYFCDYLVRFKDKSEDWFDEFNLKHIRKYTRKEQKNENIIT